MLDEARLIQTAVVPGSGGSQNVQVVSDRQVLCSSRGVGIKESYAALAINRKPEIKLILPNRDDYQGEQYAVYRGRRFVVLRAYPAGFGVELTLECTRDLEGLVE